MIDRTKSGVVVCRHGVAVDMTISTRWDDDAATLVMSQSVCKRCVAEALGLTDSAPAQPVEHWKMTC